MTVFLNGKKWERGKKVDTRMLIDIWRFQIGSASEDQKLTGLIDGLRISNCVRYDKDLEIQPEFAADEQTVALYHFDQNDNNIFFDHSGNKRHVRPAKVRWETVKR